MRPLTRPLGRCCLDDDCPCRHDPGTRSRQLERELGRMGVPTLATALIKVLARRGERIAAALRELGYEPLEVYPFATLRLLGLPWRGKRTPAGRRAIYRGLRPLVPGLRHPRASEHQLDAVVCALTAQLWRKRRHPDGGTPRGGADDHPGREALQAGRGGLGIRLIGRGAPPISGPDLVSGARVVPLNPSQVPSAVDGGDIKPESGRLAGGPVASSGSDRILSDGVVVEPVRPGDVRRGNRRPY